MGILNPSIGLLTGSLVALGSAGVAPFVYFGEFDEFFSWVSSKFTWEIAVEEVTEETPPPH